MKYYRNSERHVGGATTMIGLIEHGNQRFQLPAFPHTYHGIAVPALGPHTDTV